MILALTLTLGCTYEHATRSGPLSGLSDSLFPDSVQLKCRQADILLPTESAYRTCAATDTSAQWMDIARTGLVLGIVVNWADDSVGQIKAHALAEHFTAISGAEPRPGEADATEEETSWTSDSVCYGLFRAFQHRGYQAVWYLSERYGHCG